MAHPDHSGESREGRNGRERRGDGRGEGGNKPTLEAPRGWRARGGEEKRTREGGRVGKKQKITQRASGSPETHRLGEAGVGEGGAAAGTQEDAKGVERRKPRLLHWSAFSERCMRLVMRDWANIEI